MSQKLSLEQRRTARELARKGRWDEAIATLLRLINATQDSPNRDDHALLGLYHYNAGRMLEAANILAGAAKKWPQDLEIIKNIGVCYSRAGAFAEAEPWLLRAVQQDEDDPNLHAALTDVYFQIGDKTKSKMHGERTLLLKAASVCNEIAPIDLKGPIPEFDESQPDRNVISFSLWGSAERYVEGALTNARLAPHIYPGWRCRFYVEETISDRIVSRLLAHGADVVKMPKQAKQYQGLFWRFLPSFDPNLDRFLVRDADSIISLRERLAVDEWLQSDKRFHILRDHPKHTDTILAGLWGGVAGVLPDLTVNFEAYLDALNKTANCDQKFLGEIVWPLVRHSVMIHDSHYDVLGAQPFPKSAKLPANQHVGQDASVHSTTSLGRLTDACKTKSNFTQRKRFVFSMSPGRAGTTYVTGLLKKARPDIECHHERTGYGNMGVLSPDASTLMLFNSQGNVPEVRNFWKRKFSLMRTGPSDCYVEISHFLCKAGLIENLDLLGADVEIEIVDLRRDVFSVAWSFANRFDFANNGFTWLFALDWGYPRCIVDPAPFRKHGMFGHCLWYVAEMYTRAEYYRHILQERPNIRVHTVNLEDLTKIDQANALVTSLGLSSQHEPLSSLPSKKNNSKAWALDEKSKSHMEHLVEKFQFDPAALAADYLKMGRRLASIKTLPEPKSVGHGKEQQIRTKTSDNYYR